MRRHAPHHRGTDGENHVRDTYGVKDAAAVFVALALLEPGDELVTSVGTFRKITTTDLRMVLANPSVEHGLPDGVPFRSL